MNEGGPEVGLYVRERGEKNSHFLWVTSITKTGPGNTFAAFKVGIFILFPWKVSGSAYSRKSGKSPSQVTLEVLETKESVLAVC